MLKIAKYLSIFDWRKLSLWTAGWSLVLFNVEATGSVIPIIVGMVLITFVADGTKKT